MRRERDLNCRVAKQAAAPWRALKTENHQVILTGNTTNFLDDRVAPHHLRLDAADDLSLGDATQSGEHSRLVPR